jgi:RNA polymerase sigma-70 factor, ECF subfamily
MMGKNSVNSSPMSNSIEQAAILQCQQGNKEAFSALYEQYVDRIFAYFRYRVPDEATAEDLTSQTFLKALSRINNFSEQKGSFKTWLYTIARNQLIDYYRSNRITFDLEGAQELASNEDVSAAAAARLQLETVQKYLATLPESQREIIKLRLWDELSYEEIAAATGRTVASCKMMFSRTVRTMRDDLGYLIASLLLIFITNHP